MVIVARRIRTRSAWLWQLYSTVSASFMCLTTTKLISSALLAPRYFLSVKRCNVALLFSSRVRLDLCPHSSRKADTLSPNPTSYAATLTVYVFLSVAVYRDGKLRTNYMICKVAVWSPLYTGASYCESSVLPIQAARTLSTDVETTSLGMLGNVSAFPDALRLRGKRIGCLQRTLLKPVVFNSVLMCGPALCFATLLIPTLLANPIFNQLPSRCEYWLDQAANPAADIAELAREAREIWLSSTRTYWYLGMAFYGEHGQALRRRVY